MMNVTAYAQRCNRWWAVEVPEIPELFTQAERLDQIPYMVRNAATMLGMEVKSVAVEPVP